MQNRVQDGKMVNQFIPKAWKHLAIATITTTVIISASAATADSSSTDYLFLIDNNQQTCQQMGQDYQQIKAFETANFYVNICQKEDKYYYLGEAKAGTINTIFLPASSIVRGKIYQANNGNLLYTVKILAQEATLTIERNGVLVAIENSQNQKCFNSPTVLPVVSASQIYPIARNSQIILDDSYLQLNQSDNIELTSFYELNLLREFDTEAMLNALSCH